MLEQRKIKYHKLIFEGQIGGLFQCNNEEMIQQEIKWVLSQLPAGAIFVEIQKEEYYALLESVSA